MTGQRTTLRGPRVRKRRAETAALLLVIAAAGAVMLALAAWLVFVVYVLAT